MAAHAVEEHGSAEIIGVPGEQTTLLRAELRRLFKSRFGYRGQTVLMNDVLLVTCDQATEQARSTRRRQAADLLDQRSGAEPVDDSGDLCEVGPAPAGVVLESADDVEAARPGVEVDGDDGTAGCRGAHGHGSGEGRGPDSPGGGHEGDDGSHVPTVTQRVPAAQRHTSAGGQPRREGAPVTEHNFAKVESIPLNFGNR